MESSGKASPSQTLFSFNQKYGMSLTEAEAQDLIPSNYIEENIRMPILDVPEFCRKLQDMYDKEWESRERKEKDVETVKKNLMRSALAAGIDRNLIQTELDALNYTNICDVPRLLDINDISFSSSLTRYLGQCQGLAGSSPIQPQLPLPPKPEAPLKRTQAPTLNPDVVPPPLKRPVPICTKTYLVKKHKPDESPTIPSPVPVVASVPTPDSPAVVAPVVASAEPAITPPPLPVNIPTEAKEPTPPPPPTVSSIQDLIRLQAQGQPGQLPKLRKKPVIKVPELKPLSSMTLPPLVKRSTPSLPPTPSTLPPPPVHPTSSTSTPTAPSLVTEPEVASAAEAPVPVPVAVTVAEVPKSPLPISDNNGVTAVTVTSSPTTEPVLDKPTPSEPPAPPPPARAIRKPPPPPPRSIPEPQSTRFTCSPCSITFGTKASLSSHWTQVHPSLSNAFVLEPSPRCVTCLKIFPFNCSELTSHVGTCSGSPAASTLLELADKLRRCPVCSSLYSNTEKASLCLARKHNRIRCYLCLGVFPLFTSPEDGGKKNTTVARHIKDFHSKSGPDGKNILPCRFCPTELDNNRALVEHLVEFHYGPCLEEQEGSEGGNGNNQGTGDGTHKEKDVNVGPKGQGQGQGQRRASDVQSQEKGKQGAELKRGQSEGQPQKRRYITKQQQEEKLVQQPTRIRDPEPPSQAVKPSIIRRTSLEERGAKSVEKVKPPKVYPGVSPDVDVKCSFCKEWFPSRKELQNHMTIEHRIQPNPQGKQGPTPKPSSSSPQQEQQQKKANPGSGGGGGGGTGDNLRRGSLEGRVLQVNKSTKLTLQPIPMPKLQGPRMRMGNGPLLVGGKPMVVQYPGVSGRSPPPRPRGLGVGLGGLLPRSPLAQVHHPPGSGATAKQTPQPQKTLSGGGVRRSSGAVMGVRPPSSGNGGGVAASPGKGGQGPKGSRLSEDSGGSILGI